MNRLQRRNRVRHLGVYTRKTVWRDWMDMPLNKLGVAIRVMRIANRRGKSISWAAKRLEKDYKKLLAYQQGRNANLQKIYEEMQQGMLQGEEHDHEH